MQIRFIYDKDMQCLVKLVDGIEESRMSIDFQALQELQYDLTRIIYYEKDE